MSHAFGAKNYPLVGIFFQRGMMVNLAFFMLISPILYNLDYFMGILMINPKVATHAITFIYYAIPSYVFFSFSDGLRSFMMA